MKRLFTIIIVLAVSLLGGASAAGQKVNPDTLTISKTIPAYGCSAERMFDILNAWKPEINEIRKDYSKDMDKKMVKVFFCDDIGFDSEKDSGNPKDHLFFNIYVKCMPDSCVFCISNLVLACGHGGEHYFRLSSADSRLNRNGIWILNNKKTADRARAYSLELFYRLSESIETYLNTPETIQMRRIR